MLQSLVQHIYHTKSLRHYDLKLTWRYLYLLHVSPASDYANKMNLFFFAVPLFPQTFSWSWTKWWVLWSSTPAAWQNWCVTRGRASTGCGRTQSLFPSGGLSPCTLLFTHTHTHFHLSLLRSEQNACKDTHTHTRCAHKQTMMYCTQSTSGPHVHTDVMNFLDMSPNTVSIFYTSLPKTLSNLEHVMPHLRRWRRRRRRTQRGSENCNGNQELTAWLHISAILRNPSRGLFCFVLSLWHGSIGGNYLLWIH